MDFWLAVVIIVAITSFAKVLHSRRPDPGAAAPETAALAREVAGLEERIRVLERIVTENRTSRDLAHEIESLRQG